MDKGGKGNTPEDTCAAGRGWRGTKGAPTVARGRNAAERRGRWAGNGIPKTDADKHLANFQSQVGALDKAVAAGTEAADQLDKANADLATRQLQQRASLPSERAAGASLQRHAQGTHQTLPLRASTL